MKKFMVCILVGLFLTGCGIAEGKTYTREELENLARLEVYEAGSDTLLKTTEDEETLYRYIQAIQQTEIFSGDMEMETEFEMEAETEEEAEAELKELAEGAEESYYLVVYKYPAARFGDTEPKMIYKTTLYRDINVVKLTMETESLKNLPLLEELLTFYYELPKEEEDFYESLLAQE